MTRTEEKTIRELEAKGYDVAMSSPDGTVNTSNYNKMNRTEAKAIADQFRKEGRAACIVGPNPYTWPFRVMVKKAPHA